jgi:hypothetical protein
MKLAFVLGLALGISALGVDAEERYFNDQKATSPSGRREIYVTSPDNDGPRRPQAEHFKYSLLDASTQKVIWSRLQPMKSVRGAESPDGEGSPVQLFLSDSSFVVVHTASDELVVLEPKQGRKILQANILGLLTSDEIRKYVADSAIGPNWIGLSRWYFLSVEDLGVAREYFVIRPFWGRRLFFSLTAGRIVPDTQVGVELLSGAKRAELTWLLDTLSAVETLARRQAENPRPQRDVETAAWLAGTEGVREAIPFLRTLESTERIQSKSIKYDSYGYQANLTRQIAQLSLRRLGERPVCAAPLALCRPLKDQGEKDSPGVVMQSMVAIEDRIRGVSDVSEGQSVEGLLASIGSPDYVDSSHLQSFDYDFDGDVPFTLRVHLDPAGKKIDSLKRFDEPLWKSDLVRDAELAHQSEKPN